MSSSNVSVLVVGAGPTGLTMALSLTKYGVKVRVIEELSVPHEAIRGTAIMILSILEVKKDFDARALPPLQMAVYDPSGINILKAFDWSQGGFWDRLTNEEVNQKRTPN